MFSLKLNGILSAKSAFNDRVCGGLPVEGLDTITPHFGMMKRQNEPGLVEVMLVIAKQFVYCETVECSRVWRSAVRYSQETGREYYCTALQSGEKFT